MKPRWLTLLGSPGTLACACALLALPASAADRLLVQVPAILEPGAPIAEAVRAECAVDKLVGHHVFDQVALHAPAAEPVVTLIHDGPESFLKLSILSVHGVGGGSWSGAKSMTLRVQLLEKGRHVAMTVVQRNSRGGPLGGVSGTCAIMERIAVALGRDVAKWLPTAFAARDAARTAASAAAPAAEIAPAAEAKP
jgi:hypothetical protein